MRPGSGVTRCPVCGNHGAKFYVKWRADATKKEYELIKKQIENENLRYRVYKTLEANNENN